MSRLPDPGPDFDEARYLEINPDVADAVRAGAIGSAYEHWQRYGRYEIRAGGAPPDPNARVRRLRAAARKPFGVNYYGFQSTASGLGTAARSYTRALQARAIAQHAVIVPQWSGRFPENEEPSPSRTEFRINLIHQNADMMAFFAKTYGLGLFESNYNIGIWVWELAVANAEWHKASRLVDEIWVPSTFCQHAFASVSAVPVLRIPHAVVPPEPGGGPGRSHFGIPEEAFAFLYVFDAASYVERKNPAALVHAFLRAFGDSSRVVLVLKFLNEDRDPAAIESLRALAGHPNIRLLSGAYTAGEIASLHNHADCFVSPHRTEGFGLNIAEAMWRAKPVIATGYSGNMDFTTPETSFLIDYELQPIRQPVGPYRAGLFWAEPSVAHLSALLREVFENREGARRKGERAARLIRRDYSPNAIGRLMEKRFSETGLGDHGPMRAARLAAAAAYRAAPGPTARMLSMLRR